jgi:hypothetical protein
MFRNSQFRLLAVGALAASAIVACSEEDDTDPVADTGSDAGAETGGDTTGDTTAPGEDITVSENILADTTWTANNRYFLSTLVFVQGATLTIEAGTQIFGAEGSALVVARDARIEAVGTADAPIVFTSDNAEGDRAPSDWGGVVLLGNAPINVGTANIEGMEASNASQYGGTDAAHDCGTLKYVRIEWAGFTFGTDNELNGLTIGGCGTGTELSYIQVHKGSDDGIEFFGGTVNADHLVVTGAQDDSVDWDEGYQGKIQFLVVQQDGTNGDRGIEADNLEDDNDAEPRSNPTIYNATFVGSVGNEETTGITLRRGTAAFIANSIVMNFGDTCMDIDSRASADQVEDGNLGFSHILFFNCGADGMSYWKTEDDDACDCEPGSEGCTEPNCFLEEEFFTTDNVPGLVTGMDPMLGAPTNTSMPNFVPAAGSPAANGATTIPAGFDATATYIGAFAPGGANWMDGWTAFP